jgi:hypothetical protein
MIPLMYHLQNVFILTFVGFLYISTFFSLYIKYLGIFLSDMKNIVTDGTGKAFTKAKKLFSLFWWITDKSLGSSIKSNYPAKVLQCKCQCCFFRISMQNLYR